MLKEMLLKPYTPFLLKTAPLSSTNPIPQLRLRVFAGPNGSGKSTVIAQVRQYKSAGRPIDFGYYINADDIATDLRGKGFQCSAFDVKISTKEFSRVALESGLINDDFDAATFKKSFSIYRNQIKAKNHSAVDKLAQILADYLRKRLLAERKRFSFETVFSHPSKLDIMKKAADAGYKVYLYYVSTESPEINVYRVYNRKLQGGHDVPPEKIKSRYYRSLELLYPAAQLSYQAYFFDNSTEGEELKMFAHFKKAGDEKKWDKINRKKVPYWFKKYYSEKVKK